MCWKSTFQYVRMSLCPENVGNWSSSPRNDLKFSPKSIQSECTKRVSMSPWNKTYFISFKTIMEKLIMPASPLKKYLSVRSHQLLARKCWKLVFLASEWVGAFCKIYPELFPASPGAQLKEITVSTFLYNWVKYDHNRPSNRKKRFFRSHRGL